MASHREIAERAAKEWEKHAHSTTFLDTKLHPKAMGWLIDAIERAITGASSGAGSKPTEMPTDIGIPAHADTDKGRSKGKNQGKKGASK